MPSSKLPAPLARSRVEIRDRAHAHEIARAIPLASLFGNGGTVAGFADWLFVHRKTFNGANPLQQPSVYANRYGHAKKRGEDFDAVCREWADQQEQSMERARATFESNLATIEGCWADQQGGSEVIQAIAELCLGRGQCFADSPEGEPLPNPPSWVLKGLLKIFEDIGGPYELLDRYELGPESSEDSFRNEAPQLDARMMMARDMVLSNEPPSASDVFRVTCAARLLSCMSSVRTTLGVLLVQTEMVERIEAKPPTSASTGPAAARRSRAV
jgi:hypothetical protein